MSFRLYDATGKEVKVNMSTFPGGEPHVNACEISGGFAILDARVRTFNDLGEILVLTNYLHKKCLDVHLYLPYFPGARQDRGIPLTVEVYAEIINEAEFKTVTIVDPHSDVAPALLNNLYILSTINTGVREFLGEADYKGLICPDAGATKRVDKVARATGLPVYYAHKKRIDGGPAGQEVSIQFHHEYIPRGRFCVVDDILDGGATFVALKKAFDSLTGGEDRTLDLWATHTIQDRGRFAVGHAGYSKLGTTDSFYQIVQREERFPWEAESQDNVVVYPLFERMMNNAE